MYTSHVGAGTGDKATAFLISSSTEEHLEIVKTT